MSPTFPEWLNLVLRWAHVVAAIMWIGDSFLFMWLDSSLEKPARPREGEVVGELWMTHSGGFYEVVKHRALAHLPPRLHWFEWQSYTTWITGVLLLLVVFGLGGRVMLLDPASPLSHGEGMLIVLGVLGAGVLGYDLLCRIPLLRDGRVMGVVGLALITALTWALTRVFLPRAAFLLIGAMLGSIMTANVFFGIIPAQRHMVEATRAGRPVDTSYGARAKQRSIHNHYLTLPVLFTMLSNHFPGLYGHSYAWAVLGLLFVLGAGAKHVMNRGARTHALVYAGTLASLVGVALLTAPPGDPPELHALDGHPPVDQATASAIVQMRCVPCHATHPSNGAFAAPPAGVALEREDLMEAYAERILVRAYLTHTMPLGNLTGITEAERVTLGAWALQQRQR